MAELVRYAFAHDCRHHAPNINRLAGDIIYIHIFGNPILILNSAKVTDDLLEKRGTIYSSRPRRVMLQEL